MQLRRVLAVLVAFCQLGMGVLIPAADAAAKPGEISWAGPTKYVWRNTDTGIPVQMWDAGWNTLATVNLQNKSAYDVRMTNGPQWITKGLRAGGLAGLTDNQIAGALVDYANASGAMVYGRYSPELHTLRVSVVRMFRNQGRNTLDIQERPFAPVDGRWFVQQRKFLSNFEFHRSIVAGNDPFVGMSTDYTDPEFYNIANIETAMVIMGLASQYSGVIKGVISLLAVDQTDTRQKQSSSGNWWRRTVKTDVDSYTKAQWFVGLPKDQQPGGNDPAFCVKPLASCDDPGHLVYSGLAWRPWSGGNMPEQLDHIYHWETQSTSWTLGAFTILIAVAVTAMTAGAGAIASMALLTQSIGVGTALTAGLAAGAVYAGAGMAQGGGGLGMTQSNVAYGNIGRNLAPAQAPNGEVQTGINNAIQNTFMAANPQNSISGVKQAYAGNCAAQYTARQCWEAGLDPGHILRADVYGEMNGVLILRDRYDWCKGVGWTGADLNRCAAAAKDGNNRDIYGSYVAPRLSPDDNYLVNTYYPPSQW